jgi:hypothetical protein
MAKPLLRAPPAIKKISNEPIFTYSLAGLSSAAFGR